MKTSDLSHLNIGELPFSRRLSYLSLTCADGGLILHRMARTYGENAELRRDRHIRFNAIEGAMMVSAVPHILTASAENGTKLEVCFDGTECLRFKGDGAGLTVTTTQLNGSEGEYMIDRLDGTVQITLFRRGEFLFKPIRGTVELVSEQILIKSGIDEVFEFSVYFADEFVEVVPQKRGFDECAAESLADFESWYSLFASVSEQYEPMKKLAVYMIWICQIAAKGELKDPSILFSKPTEQACFSWHQVYHSMVMRDPDWAVQTLMNLFGSQDEYGELPDLVDDRNVNITATKPPFHGYGLIYILERLKDKITDEHCRLIYGRLANLYGYWTTLRDTDGDGVPQYNHGCESGHDFSAMFKSGVPVETPDIITYIALLAEGLAKLAERLGLTAEALDWNCKRDFLIEKLIAEFWDGDQFVARLSGTHEIVEFDELEAYLPLMLGERLPPVIVERCMRDLGDPEIYYTPYGFRSTPKRVDAPGVIMGFSQIKILPGLYRAGKREFAMELLRGFCDYGLEHVPGFLFIEPGHENGGGFPGFMGLSALSGAIWLGCASFLWEAENELYKQ